MTNFYAQRHLRAFLLTSLAIASGCQSKTEPAPEPVPTAKTEPFDIESDIFSRAHGYWEWTRSINGGGRAPFTPASVGFTRQLVFKGDSMVHIYHNQTPALTPIFHLHVGSVCSSNPRPLIDFDAESVVPNNRIRSYSVSRAIYSTRTDTTLTIVGERACVDGGQYEYYIWHHR
jgi:hypothetical protein